MKTDVNEIENIIDIIESGLQDHYKVLDGDGSSIILKSEETDCDFEIVIKTID